LDRCDALRDLDPMDDQRHEGLVGLGCAGLGIAGRGSGILDRPALRRDLAAQRLEMRAGSIQPVGRARVRRCDPGNHRRGREDEREHASRGPQSGHARLSTVPEARLMPSRSAAAQERDDP
jgi:hypothetical protein